MTPISRSETRLRLVRDKERIRSILEEIPGTSSSWLFAHPCYQAIWFHRWSHYFFVKGNRLLARFLWHLNILLTGADINPLADLGPGMVILNPVGVILHGMCGENFTVYGRGGMGGGLDRKDIGAGPGLPIVGNNVVMEYGAYVLGPIRIGDNAVIKAGAAIHRDVPADTIRNSPASRIIPQSTFHRDTAA